MAKRKLYDVLGVPREATEQQIRKAFRDLARKYHPDRNPGDKQAEERFKEVNRASEVLLNKEKRELYDEFGEMGLREGFDAAAYRSWNARRAAQGAGGFSGGGGQGFGGLEDIFEQMRRSGGGRAEGAGGFADFFNSEIFNNAGRRARGGRGAAAQPTDATADIEIEWMEAVLGTEKELAISAGGEEPRTIRVRIPAGVRDEGQVRLRGQSPDGGDIVLRIHVKQHPFYRRTEDDLELTLPITVGEAFHGAKVQVPTPYGAVQLRIPKGVRGGSRMRLKGKGVRRGDKAGDLFVDLQIVLPPSEQGAEAIDALEKLYEGSVRPDLETVTAAAAGSGGKES
jgi:DnaJ-class molecular chaperone